MGRAPILAVPHVEASSVELEGVSKAFGDVTALHEVTLDARPGEFLVLLGPSGCGKSTVLRLIAGLEAPTAGTIRIGGAAMNRVVTKDRDVAMVFQSYALYPHLSVRKNIEFPLRSRGVSRDDIKDIVPRVAESLQLTPFLGRKPAALSGGQRQRVALARALVRRPKVFLMDEPLSNLDAQLRVEMRAELVELHRQLGITILYVTHDQIEAMTMGQRIAVLKDGVLQQLDTPESVRDTPSNAFVASFVGSPPMNILSRDPDRVRGTALRGDRGRARPTACVRCRPRPRPLARVRPPRRAARGPVHRTRRVSSAATVSLVESMGRLQHVTCRLPTDISSASRAPSTRPSTWATRSPCPSCGPLHLFDPTTQLRLS